MYEKLSDRLASTEQFLWRVVRHTLYVALLLIVSLAVGALGFFAFEGHDPAAAVIQAAHILSGFGLIQMPETIGGHLFATAFGLYASFFFLAAFSIIFAPIVHRLLHKFHLDEDDASKR